MMAYLIYVIIILIAIILGIVDKKKLLYYFVFLYPILPEYFAVNITNSLPLLTASRMLFGIFCLSLIIRKPKLSVTQLKRVNLLNPMILLIMTNTIVLIGHFSFGSTLKDYFNFLIENVIFIVVLTNVISDIKEWNKCINVLMTSAMLSFLLGSIESFTQVNIASSLLNTNARTDLLMSNYERYGLLRSSFTFGHSICLANFCVCFIPLFINRVTERKNARIVGLMLCLMCLLTTISRWPIAVGGGILIFCLLQMTKEKRKKLQIPLLTLGVISVIAIIAIPSVSKMVLNSILSTLNAFGANFNIEGSTRNVNAIASRASQLQMIMQTLTKHPFVGFGGMNFDEMGLWVNTLAGKYRVVSIDMEYLNWIVSYGIVGFIGFFQWYCAIIFNLKRKIVMVKDGRLKALYIGLIGLMLCYLAVDQLTTNRIFNMLLAMAIARVSIEQKDGEMREYV